MSSSPEGEGGKIVFLQVRESPLLLPDLVVLVYVLLGVHGSHRFVLGCGVPVRVGDRIKISV